MRKQEELQKDVETKKEIIDELEITKTTLNQRIVKLETELLKEKEVITNKQHQIEKLEEEHTKFERNSKLFDAQKANLELSIEENKKSI